MYECDPELSAVRNKTSERSLPYCGAFNVWVAVSMSEEKDQNLDHQPPPTIPANVPIQIRSAFDDEDRAHAFANRVGSLVYSLSCYIELSTLDGITIAGDYHQALLDLDRGYSTNHKLSPSEGYAIGIAMTVHVLREEQLKSHIVVNASAVCGLEDEQHELFQLGVHTLAHECAHVAVTAAFERAFPRFILRTGHTNVRLAFRWQVILACWDEYAASRLSALYGEDPTSAYEETFLTSLRLTRDQANGLIKAYRHHGDVERVMGEVYGCYGNLLKFAAYLLGNMAGQGLDPATLARTSQVLDGHWFADYFDRLRVLCESLFSKFGSWTSQELFEAIGDLVDEVVSEGGIQVTDLADGMVYARIPFTPETT